MVIIPYFSKWSIESIDANKNEVKNGLRAIAVVPAEDYKPNKEHYDNIIYSFRGTVLTLIFLKK
ncbi:hypothetical protein [Bacillus bingmayongensis]|uniref:hypothetical protein n=1 Tax=Bacillus bingmayongensis TaxID=1150157 RepID=UPI00031F4676|nr:hypothetical protein [Bacillus bingmayongensis]MBY0597764.1 hypothetical protein [Bacillus bingmayongensis]